jgi:hypothetical protein
MLLKNKKLPLIYVSNTFIIKISFQQMKLEIAGDVFLLQTVSKKKIAKLVFLKKIMLFSDF